MGRQKRFEVVVDAFGGNRGKCWHKVLTAPNMMEAKTKAGEYLESLMTAYADYALDEWDYSVEQVY